MVHSVPFRVITAPFSVALDVTSLSTMDAPSGLLLGCSSQGRSGTRSDVGVGLKNPDPGPSKLIELSYLRMNSVPRIRPMGSRSTTRTHVAKVPSAGGKTRKRTHVPRMVIGGSLLPSGLAALKRPLPFLEIMLRPPYSACSISWMNFLLAKLPPPAPESTRALKTLPRWRERLFHVYARIQACCVPLDLGAFPCVGAISALTSKTCPSTGSRVRC